MVYESEVKRCRLEQADQLTILSKHKWLLKILDDYCNSKNITRAEGVRQAVKLLKEQ